MVRPTYFVGLPSNRQTNKHSRARPRGRYPSRSGEPAAQEPYHFYSPVVATCPCYVSANYLGKAVRVGEKGTGITPSWPMEANNRVRGPRPYNREGARMG